MSQVLALKYRPKNFSQLIGQPSVSQSLSHALDSKRIGHAYLFSGLRGSGKTSSARIFAKALLCEKGPTSRPCEECENCKMANAGTHMDIIEMDAASRRKIDDIRELIERTRTAPAVGRYKIFIIDEVHMLTKEAANAFLKTLEEPPPHAKFILATTDPLKLPATILSRTQHFRFKPIALNLIKSHLEDILNLESVSYEIEAIDIIARSGSGSLRDSITLLDQAISFTDASVNTNLVADMLGLLDPSKIDEILNVVIKQDRDALLEVLKELENYDAETIIEQLTVNIKDKFLGHQPKFSPLMYERFFRILSEARLMLGNDDSFTLAMTLFMMMEALNLKDIDEEILRNEKIAQEEVKPKVLKTTNSVLTEPKIISSESPFPKSSEYEQYLKELYDRNYELGECFKEAIEFVKFEDNTLFVISHAEDKNRKILRKSSKAIMAVLRQVFGKNANIKISQHTDNSKDQEASVQNTQAKNNSETAKDINSLKNDFDRLKEVKNSLMSEEKDDIKSKNSQMLDDLKSSNNYSLSDEEKKLNELRRLFGDPKLEI
ncbi:MAG: DNA polymerase III subunit gamma/tau [Campylobacter sp.]|nr:DNA polymerase III subunit gamma/tau [Campylobacter sp.]